MYIQHQSIYLSNFSHFKCFVTNVSKFTQNRGSYLLTTHVLIENTAKHQSVIRLRGVSCPLPFSLAAKQLIFADMVFCFFRRPSHRMWNAWWLQRHWWMWRLKTLHLVIMQLNIKCQVIITVEHRQCVSELMRHPCSSNILPYLSKFPTWDDLTTFSIRSQNLHLTFCLPLSPSPFWVSNCPTVHKRQREKRDYDPPPNVISTPPCVEGGRCRVRLFGGFVVLLH